MSRLALARALVIVGFVGYCCPQYFAETDMAEPTSMKLGTPAVVTLSSTTAQSAAIGTANSGQPDGYTVVRVAVTADTWCAIGTNPTAAANTAGSFFMPAGTCEYFDLPFGYKIAGIVASTGYMSVTPMSKT